MNNAALTGGAVATGAAAVLGTCSASGQCSGLMSGISGLFNRIIGALAGLGGTVFNDANDGSEAEDPPGPGHNNPPDETVGDKPRDSKGRRNTEKPGGNDAAESDFEEYAEGEITTLPDGTRVAENGVRIRTGRDGRTRVDLPAGTGKSNKHETIHYNN